jgi:CRP/FNR family cyclic AMP-dependent transcriptional regulator
MDAAAALRASPLLEGFTETGLGILAGACTVRSFPQGSLLFAEEMVSDSLLVIAEGRVSLSVRADAGEVPLGELDAGEWLGELSLIETGQRACTARALTPVTALELRQADFHALTATRPQACVKLLMAISLHLGRKILANKDALRSLVKR